MIHPNNFIESARQCGVTFYTGVPDSLLKNLLSYLNTVDDIQHYVAPNEGSAVALASGYYLATGQLPFVYLQNSGLGNAINPLASLTHSSVYSIPLLLLIGWRGETFPDGTQINDEPQHLKQGRITSSLLQQLDIPFYVIDCECDDLLSQLRDACNHAKSTSSPVAILVRRNTFHSINRYFCDTSLKLSRTDAFSTILSEVPPVVPIVATTGFTGRQVYASRLLSSDRTSQDFLCIGSMGHANQIAAGIAISHPSRHVVCLDGDGALLMHLGSLALTSQISNYIHVLLNNGVHDSVGGQPTNSNHIDFCAIASACGYKMVFKSSDVKSLSFALSTALASHYSTFIEVLISPNPEQSLPRPAETPLENRLKFMQFLSSNIL